MSEDGDGEELKRQFLSLVYETVRHLCKQDTLEEANFFDEEYSPYRDWNNDTVVAAMQAVIEQWVQEHWQLEYIPYDTMYHGIVPANRDILRQLGLRDHEASAGGDDE